MAKLFITEYAELAVDAKGRVMQCGREPAVAEQVVTYSTAAVSTAFNRRTTLIRVHADADAYIQFGVNPTATANSKKIEANVTEYFGVDVGNQPTGFAVSAYDGSS